MPTAYNFSDVFISYSRLDGDFVRRLVSRLEAEFSEERGVWIDWEDIPRSVEWWSEIKAGIDGADSFVLVMSPASIASPICQMEIAHAIEGGKRIIPVFYQDPQKDASFERMMQRIAEDAFVRGLMGERDPLALAQANWQRLAAINWVFMTDATDKDFDKGYYDLIETINTDIEHMRTHTRLLVRALEWDARGRVTGFLLRGESLDEAEFWLTQAVDKDPNPTALQAEYIATSRQAASRRQRIIQGATVAALIGALLFSVALFFTTQDANTQRQIAQTAAVDAQNAQVLAEDNGGTAVANAATATVAQGEALFAEGTAVAERDRANMQARLALSRQLAAQSASILPSDPDLGLLLALEGFRVDETEEARTSLIAALQQAPNILYSLQPSGGEVIGLAFSPDASTLLTISGLGTAELWSMTDGQPLGVPISNTSGLRAPTFTADAAGRAIIQLQSNLGAATTLLDAQSGTLLALQKPAVNENLSPTTFEVASRDASRSAQVTLDGDTVIQGLPDRTPITVIPAADLDDVDTTREPRISDDGGVVVVHSLDWMQVWFEKSGEVVSVPQAANTTFIRDVGLSGDGSTLAFVDLRVEGADVLSIIDLESMKERYRWPLPLPADTGVERVVLNSVGDTAYIGTDTGIVAVIDVTTGQPLIPSIRAHIGEVFMLAVSADGRYLASGDDRGRVLVWDVERTDRLAAKVSDTVGQHIAFTPDARWIIEAGRAGLFVYDTATRQPLAALTDPARPRLMDIAMHPNGRSFVGITQEPDDGAHDLIVYGIEETDDQTVPLRIVERARTETLDTAWRVALTVPQNTANPQQDAVIYVASLVVAEAGLAAYAYDAADSTLSRLNLPDEVVGRNVVAISPAGDQLATIEPFTLAQEPSSQDNSSVEILLYPLDADALPYGEPRALFHPDFWLSEADKLVFSRDGRLLAGANFDRDVGVWDLASAALVGPAIAVNADRVSGIGLNPEGTQLATADTTGLVTLWDPVSGQQNGVPLARVNGLMLDLDYAADGQLVASSTAGTLLWRIESSGLQAAACARVSRSLSPQEWERFIADLSYRISCPELTLLEADRLALSGQPEAAAPRFSELVPAVVALNLPELNAAACIYGALMGFPKQALPACEQALALIPDNTDYHDYHAVALALSGDFDAAADTLATAESLAPGAPNRARWQTDLRRGAQPFHWRERAALRAIVTEQLPYPLTQAASVPLRPDEGLRTAVELPAKPRDMVRWLSEHSLSFSPFLALDLHQDTPGWVLFGGLPRGQLSLYPYWSEADIALYAASDDGDAVAMAYATQDDDFDYGVVIQSPLGDLSEAQWLDAVRAARADLTEETRDDLTLLTATRQIGGAFTGTETAIERFFVRDGLRMVLYVEREDMVLVEALTESLLSVSAVAAPEDLLGDQPQPVTVQEAGTLARGQNLGSVPLGGVETWQYTGCAGEVLTIETRANWDVELRLFTADGSQLTRNDDATSETDQAIIYGVTLPEDGTYTLEVGHYLLRDGGAYALYLWTADELRLVDQGAQPGYLRAGERVVWHYEGQAEAVVTVDLDADWLGEFELYGPDNRRITRSVEYNEINNFRVFVGPVTLPTDGLYSIALSAFDATDSGPYALRITPAE